MSLWTKLSLGEGLRKAFRSGGAIEPGSASYFLSRRLFLRFLAVIFLIAFVSLGVQIRALVGSKGILPAYYFLNVAKERIGPEAYRLLPTLCWFNSSDFFLDFLCWGGALLSIVLLVGFAPPLILFLLWAFYLSLLIVCRDFLGFQWDALLLEVAFLSIFLAPLQILPKAERESAPPPIVLWLLRWLLFRLMVSSGIVKLMSGDPTWRNLTALDYHYETQPLPTWTSWYMDHLPFWFQKTSVLGMFTIELAVPFLIFGPRRCRHIAFACLVGFQLLIIGTGNYAFFNWLTIALCVLLIDDAVWIRLAELFGLHPRVAIHPSRGWPKSLLAPVAAVVMSVTAWLLWDELRLPTGWLTPVERLYGWLAPINSLNRYGLFAVMTTERLEIVVEGSDDNVSWLPYEFKYKPGELSRRPQFVAPYQPRLDWQMWFAALGSYRENLWFMNLCRRLLEGSPTVLALMSGNPFGNAPPKYIRAILYQYHFTDSAQREKDGTWWSREQKGLYCPVFSLPPKNQNQ